MFDLVNDITAYPEFLNWCQGSRVESSTETEVVASLEVGLGGFKKRFTTRNTLRAPERIDVELVRGPFRSLRGTWRFEEQPDSGCLVKLELDFEVAHTPLDMMFAMLFEDIVRSQITAFTARAQLLYG